MTCFANIHVFGLYPFTPMWVYNYKSKSNSRYSLSTVVVYSSEHASSEMFNMIYLKVPTRPFVVWGKQYVIVVRHIRGCPPYIRTDVKENLVIRESIQPIWWSVTPRSDPKVRQTVYLGIYSNFSSMIDSKICRVLFVGLMEHRRHALSSIMSFHYDA